MHEHQHRNKDQHSISSYESDYNSSYENGYTFSKKKDLAEKEPALKPKSKLPSKKIPAGREAEYFAAYKRKAEKYLARHYKLYPLPAGKEALTGKHFADAAERIYMEYEDLNYVVPVEIALAQARHEGGIDRKERTLNNIFNIGARDDKDAPIVKLIKTLEDGFSFYYGQMSTGWLGGKRAPEELIKANGMLRNDTIHYMVYATNPHYENILMGDVGKTEMLAAGLSLRKNVGEGEANLPEDVALVAQMLKKLDYLPSDKEVSTAEVCNAIGYFQRKQMVPIHEPWYQERIQVIKDSAKDNPAGAKKSLEDIAIQQGWYTDGTVSKNGLAIGVLYFLAEMGGKLPDLLHGSENGKKIQEVRRGKTTAKQVPELKKPAPQTQTPITDNFPEVVFQPLPKSSKGFSVGAPGGKYSAEIINFAADVRKIQEKLFAIGLLSESDFEAEYPQKKILPIKPIELEVTMPAKPLEVDFSEQLTQWEADRFVGPKEYQPQPLTEVKNKPKPPIDPSATDIIAFPSVYIHHTTSRERKMMQVYGKVALDLDDKVSNEQLTATIAAIEIFQREVKGGTVDGRIDPTGSTLPALMEATKESVEKARVAYTQAQKEKAEAAKRAAEQQKLNDRNEALKQEAKEKGFGKHSYLLDRMGEDMETYFDKMLESAGIELTRDNVLLNFFRWWKEKVQQWKTEKQGNEKEQKGNGKEKKGFENVHKYAEELLGYGSSELKELLKKEELTVKEIVKARELIEQIGDKKAKGDAYEVLQ
ncbi:MAG: hypothetical protein AAF734_04845, partial [Bacteroidota bacterium]